MSRARPQAIVVIAVLNLVAALFGGVWAGVNTVAQVADRELAARFLDEKDFVRIGGPSLDPAVPVLSKQQAVAQRLSAAPYLVPYQVIGRIAVPWLLTLLLVASAVGLLWTQRWGWALAIAYAVLSLLHKGAIAFYSLSFLVPIYFDELADVINVDKIDLVGPAETWVIIGMVAGPALLMIYPLIVLSVMNRRAVRKAFRSHPALVPQPAALP
jgi:hypothetical protein